MKKHCLILLLLGLSLNAIGQKHLIGAQVGTNLSTINSSAFTSIKLGLVAGVGYEFRFSRLLSLEARLAYNQRGTKAEITYTNEQAQEIRNVKTPYTHHYISLPISFGVVSSGNLYGIGKVGLVASYLLKATAKIPDGTNHPNTGMPIDVSDQLFPFDVAAMIEGGLGTAIGERWQLEGILGFQHGITNVFDLGPDWVTPHLGFSFDIRMKYVLGGLSE